VILVDTSVWAAYFNGQDGPQVCRLDTVLSEEQEQIFVIPIIVMEVLQGFRSESGFRKAEELLVGLSIFDPPLQTHVNGAKLFRRLRRKGVTVRGAVDCLIAQVCIETESELLSADRDFTHIAQHTSLSLVANR